MQTKRSLVRLVILLAALAVLVAPSLAWPEPASTEPLAAHVCVALDDSTSMWRPTRGYPPSDPGPDPLRLQAAGVAASLLGTDVNDSLDAVAFVLFGSSEQPGQDIVSLPLTQLDSDERRQEIIAAVRESLWQKGFTRIDSALGSCLRLLEADPGASGYVNRTVLLTDGEPAAYDAAYDGLAQLNSLEPVLERYREREWSVDVILLGARALTAESQRVAQRITEATGGTEYVAREPADLLRIYTDIISAMTGRTQVAGTQIDLVDAATIPVLIDGSVESMTVTVVKTGETVLAALRDPSGTIVPEAGMVRTSSGVAETLTIKRPAPGTWHVELVGEGRVYISTVVRPASTAAPGNRAPDERQGRGSTGWSSRTLVALAAGVVLAASTSFVGWRAVHRIRGRRPRGLLALADRPAQCVSLVEIGKRHRAFGFLPRPIPAADLARELDIRAEQEAVLVFSDGSASSVPLEADGRPTVLPPGEPTPVTWAPKPLIFVLDASQLPPITPELSSPEPPRDPTVPQRGEEALFGSPQAEPSLPVEKDPETERRFRLAMNGGTTAPSHDTKGDSGRAGNEVDEVTSVVDREDLW